MFELCLEDKPSLEDMQPHILMSSTCNKGSNHVHYYS